MKLDYKRIKIWLSGPMMVLVLFALLVAGCDTADPLEESFDYEQRSSETRSANLDNHVLVLEHNIANENISVRVDGIDGLDQTEITFTRIGSGSSESVASTRLAGISIDEEVNSVAHRYFIDSQSPTGTRVDIHVRTPRRTSVRVRMMSGKLELYDVDGAIDAEIWKGWVTVLSASPYIRGYVDHGDVQLNLRPCRTDRHVNWTVEGIPGGDSRLTVTVPQEPYQVPANMTLRARASAGGISVVDLPINNPARVPVNGGLGESLDGIVPNAVGQYDLHVGSGNLYLQGWSQIPN